ncbi:MAG: gamma-glutamyl-gamma-aminobutyrate hydrolase family protein [Bacteriovoracales bacterium]|nr:gamma-glutamyl-gamma-aminobutyrate hydrolase family protein [Bacteriovoracales bacterium]
MIKIGIPARFLYPHPSRPLLGDKTMIYMGREIPRLIAHPDVLPVLIPDLDDKELLASLLHEMNGFIFQGGNDIAPERYGESPLRKDWEGDAERDSYEWDILDHAVKNEKPVLGICRGIQLINVYFGGKLFQDISHCRPEALTHNDYPLYEGLTHEVNFAKGGILEKLYGLESGHKVNSIHHQGIKELGKGLRVEAVSPKDGLIEGISWGGKKEAPLVLGVQWHPEFDPLPNAETISSKPLSDYFLSLCRSHWESP